MIDIITKTVSIVFETKHGLDVEDIDIAGHTRSNPLERVGGSSVHGDTNGAFKLHISNLGIAIKFAVHINTVVVCDLPANLVTELDVTV